MPMKKLARAGILSNAEVEIGVLSAMIFSTGCSDFVSRQVVHKARNHSSSFKQKNVA